MQKYFTDINFVRKVWRIIMDYGNFFCASYRTLGVGKENCFICFFVCFFVVPFFPPPCVFGRLGSVNNVFLTESLRRLVGCQPFRGNVSPGEKPFQFITSFLAEAGEQFEQTCPRNSWPGPQFFLNHLSTRVRLR
ncbi:hypothetical protein TNCV_1373281 [Trichonephila clavipes]|uniref:Uncharacterized protein n=1 Tax=Trichonephila clavipes TaxID=2585209 RepID=A0A8X7BLD1_TRICX|nr:hypothetical protein TNCV_1373281 [Trichonephila clavipes]